MSRSYIAIFLLLIISIKSISAKEQVQFNEDVTIVQAIFFEEHSDYASSYKLYKKLYDETKSDIYLFKESAAALLSNEHLNLSLDRLLHWDNDHQSSIESKRYLIPLYLATNKEKKAKSVAEKLLTLSRENFDLDMASNAYFYNYEFEKALELSVESYKKSEKESILFRIADIMSGILKKRAEAISLLEKHVVNNIASNDVYIYLLKLYREEKDIDGILNTYKRLYDKTEEDEYMDEIINIYEYKQDIDGVISFVEKYKKQKKILFGLYKIKKDFKKAFALADVLYAEDKDNKWIAEQGIIVFEEAENKNDKVMLSSVVEHFEKSISLGNNKGVYLNYYGYTLIDSGLDVKKGIDIVKKALLQQPNNAYYLDTLAWGYYKSNECSKAISIMKKVMEDSGSKESDIEEHWNIIQKCK